MTSAAQLQALADRESIRELVARYAWHAAQAESEEVVALFTPDGKFGSPHANFLSGDELRGFYAENMTPHDRIPLVVNHVIELAEDAADGICTMFSPWGPDGPLCGYYRDRYVRTPAGWRFQLRIWTEYRKPAPERERMV